MAFERTIDDPFIDLDQKAALFTLLRTAAEAELEIEDARYKLCEMCDFNPMAAFRCIQGPSIKGWLSASDLHLWLQSQPHPVTGYVLEDVLAIVKLRTGTLEIFPEDFVRMTTPTFRSSGWLKELALARGARPGHMPPEVSYRLCQLFLVELDFVSRLRFHQRRLRQVAISGYAIMKYLDADEGFCAGMGGLLCSSAVRSLLMRGVPGYARPMESMLCDALLKRINPSDAAFFPADALGRLLDVLLPTAGWTAERAAFESYAYDRPRSPIRVPATSPPRLVSPRRSESPRSSRGYLGSPVRRNLDYEPISPARSVRSPASPVTPLPDYLVPDRRPPRHAGQKLYESWTNATPSPKSPMRTTGNWISELSTQDPGLSMERSLESFLPSPSRSFNGSFLREPSLERFRAGLTSPTMDSFRQTKHFLDMREQRAVQQTLMVMARIAKLDSQVEDLKSLMPACCTVEEVFAELDTMRAGYINLSDIRRFMFGYGMTVKYASFTTMVNELHLRRKIFAQHALKGFFMLPDSMDFRDVGVLTLPLTSQACQAVMDATSDDEAKSVLYLLRSSEPCPGCGFRAQRSAECAGCPSVTCPMCRTPFKCNFVVGDRPEPCYPLTSTAKTNLYRLLGGTMEAADELERGRRELAAYLTHEICGLCDVFTALACGRDSLGFSQLDLRKAYAAQGLPCPTGEQWDLLWRRFAAPNSNSVSFLDFKSQLQPFL